MLIRFDLAGHASARIPPDTISLKILLEQNRFGMACGKSTGHGSQGHSEWVHQHELPPRLIWPLNLYEIGLSALAATRRTVSRQLVRWRGVQKDQTDQAAKRIRKSERLESR